MNPPAADDATPPSPLPQAEHHLRLAGRSILLTADDRAAEAAVLPAVAHLGVDSVADDSTVRWRVRSGGEPHRFWGAGLEGPIRLGDGGFAWVTSEPDSVAVYQPERGVELWLGPGALSSGDLRAHPASSALATWLGSAGAQMFHAGAVEVDGSGVLLVGPGGTGKTTAALACAQHGAGFLADDLCIVDGQGDTLVIHALYGTAKLNPDTEARLGLGDWPGLGVTATGKRAVAMPDEVRIPASVPMAAVVVLRPPVVGPDRLESLRDGRAVGAMAATAMASAHGTYRLRRWLETAATLARSVPVHQLAVGWDLDRVVGEIVRAVDLARVGAER